jgi:hypothetical protein
MACLAAFLDGLLTNGSAVLRGRPEIHPQDQRQALAHLDAAYADARLDVAGAPISFDAAAALAAAVFVWRACWFGLQRSETEQVVEQVLQVPPAPRTAAEHFCADLTLRLLPPIYRRARKTDAGDILTTRLAQALRQAPLCGVLGDIEEGPMGGVELAGHPGLLLLYAERLAQKLQPAWVPTEGLARSYVELVFAERGLLLPPAPTATCLEGDL